MELLQDCKYAELQISQDLLVHNQNEINRMLLWALKVSFPKIKKASKKPLVSCGVLTSSCKPWNYAYLFLSVGHQPNVSVIDIANMLAARGNKWQQNMFHPHNAMVVDSSEENVQEACATVRQKSINHYLKGSTKFQGATLACVCLIAFMKEMWKRCWSATQNYQHKRVEGKIKQPDSFIL